jgi:isoleucyl-tRNA synthetase
VHLAGWPAAAAPDEALLVEIAEVREVVELGRQVRAEENVKLRQPLRRVFVYGSDAARKHPDELREELRVKEVEFVDRPPVHLRYKPNLRLLGPRLGAALPDVRAALEAGEVEEVGQGRFRAAGHELSVDELIVERAKERGWAHSDRFSVGLDLELDAALEREGRVLDLIHALNSLRRERGFELTDRIAVTVPSSEADLLSEHAEWIKQETLAVRLEADGGSLEIEKV